MSIKILRTTLDERLPVLYGEMRTIVRKDWLKVLNALTGLDVQPYESVRKTSLQFAAKIDQMHDAGTLFLVALPRALDAIAKIRKAEAND